MYKKSVTREVQKLKHPWRHLGGGEPSGYNLFPLHFYRQFHQHFTYEFFERTYVSAAFTTYMLLEKSCQNNILYNKRARLMLMKLTPTQESLEAEENQLGDIIYKCTLR